MQTPLCGAAGALGEMALRTESGAKPLSCFSSSDLALPSGTCGHSHSPDGSQHPDGETEAGLMWVRTSLSQQNFRSTSAPISVLFLCGVWRAAPSGMGEHIQPKSPRVPTSLCAPGSPGTGQWPLPVAVPGWHNVPAGRGLPCGREGGSASGHNATAPA